MADEDFEKEQDDDNSGDDPGIEPGSIEDEFGRFEDDDDETVVDEAADDDEKDESEDDKDEDEEKSDLDPDSDTYKLLVETKGENMSLKREVAQMKKNFSQFEDLQRRSDDRSYKKSFAANEEGKRKAVEDGNIEEYDRLCKTQERYDDAFDKDYQEYTDGVDSDNVNDADIAAAEVAAQDEFNSWKEHNEWFDENPKLQKYAMFVSEHMNKTDGIGGVKLYNAVTKEVMNRYPQEFANTSNSRARTSGGARQQKGGNKAESFGNLPADAKAACKELMRDIPGYTKAQYVKDYFGGK